MERERSDHKREEKEGPSSERKLGQWLPGLTTEDGDQAHSDLSALRAYVSTSYREDQDEEVEEEAEINSDWKHLARRMETSKVKEENVWHEICIAQTQLFSAHLSSVQRIRSLLRPFLSRDASSDPQALLDQLCADRQDRLLRRIEASNKRNLWMWQRQRGRSLLHAALFAPNRRSLPQRDIPLAPAPPPSEERPEPEVPFLSPPLPPPLASSLPSPLPPPLLPSLHAAPADEQPLPQNSINREDRNGEKEEEEEEESKTKLKRGHSIRPLSPLISYKPAISDRKEVKRTFILGISIGRSSGHSSSSNSSISSSSSSSSSTSNSSSHTSSIKSSEKKDWTTKKVYSLYKEGTLVPTDVRSRNIAKMAVSSEWLDRYGALSIDQGCEQAETDWKSLDRPTRERHKKWLEELEQHRAQNVENRRKQSSHNYHLLMAAIVVERARHSGTKTAAIRKLDVFCDSLEKYVNQRSIAGGAGYAAWQLFTAYQMLDGTSPTKPILGTLEADRRAQSQLIDLIGECCWRVGSDEARREAIKWWVVGTVILETPDPWCAYHAGTAFLSKWEDREAARVFFKQAGPWGTASLGLLDWMDGRQEDAYRQWSAAVEVLQGMDPASRYDHCMRTSPYGSALRGKSLYLLEQTKAAMSQGTQAGADHKGHSKKHPRTDYTEAHRNMCEAALEGSEEAPHALRDWYKPGEHTAIIHKAGVRYWNATSHGLAHEMLQLLLPARFDRSIAASIVEAADNPSNDPCPCMHVGEETAVSSRDRAVRDADLLEIFGCMPSTNGIGSILSKRRRLETSETHTLPSLEPVASAAGTDRASSSSSSSPFTPSSSSMASMSDFVLNSVIPLPPTSTH